MRSWPNVALMLVHRLRRWPDIKAKLAQCIVFPVNSALPMPSRICQPAHRHARQNYQQRFQIARSSSGSVTAQHSA